MSEPFTFFMDQHPGLTVEGITFELLPNHGKPCWRATQKIGSIFGAEVDGELSALGNTQEQAEERLADERRKLHDSMFA